MRFLEGLTPLGAATVAVAAVVLYGLVLVLLRASRARLAARLGPADVALLLVLGAVAGRGVLGDTPSPAGAVVAILVLVLVRVLVGLVSRSGLGHRATHSRPLLLIGAGRLIDENLRHAFVRSEELAVVLRRAGVAGIGEVVCAVLEPDGTISVTRFDAARPLDRRLFASVRGIEHVPDSCFAP